MLLEALDLSKVKPIRDMAYDIIRQAICDGDLRPGDRLVESEMAEKMSISRTPVREALRKLEIEGLVKYVPHKGVLVKGFSRDDIVEIYSIRQTLEALAVKHTINNITLMEIEELRQLLAEMRQLTEKDDTEALCKVTKRFNEIMVKSSKMPRVIGLISTYQDYLERFRVVTMRRKERKVVALREHEQILQAIVDRDAVRAEKLVRGHLEGALEAYLKTRM